VTFPITEKMDSRVRGNDRGRNSPRDDRKRVRMIERLKLTIFTYKWGKCVKPVGKYLLESLIQ